MTRTAERGKGNASAATDLAAIVSHPTKRRCWSALYQRVASPKELADEFGLPTQHVDYHLKSLAKLGVVQMVDTRPVRGATEHFYALTRPYNLGEEEVAALGAEESAQNLTYLFQQQVADVAASLESGTMVERPDHHVSRRLLELDEQGWRTFFEEFEDFGGRLDRLAEDARERMEQDPDARPIHAIALLNYFEMPDPDDRVNQF